MTRVPRVLLIGTDEALERAAAEARLHGAEPVVDPADDADLVVGVGSDDSLRRAAELALATGTTHPHTPDGALRGTDLGAARRALAVAGVPQPPWRECSSAQAALTAADELGMPVVVRSLGTEVRGTATSADQVEALAARAIAASYRAACLVEAKRPGGCRRVSRSDVDAALGCEALAKIVEDEVVDARALLADCAPEQAVREALGRADGLERPREEACEPS